MRPRTWLLAALAAFATTVACGGDDTSSPTDTGETVETTEGGADGDAEAGPSCPGAPPPDDPCTSPGQICEYPIPSCGTMHCECTAGRWNCTGGHDCDAGTDADADVPDVPTDVPAEVEPDVPADAPAEVEPDVPADVPADAPAEVEPDVPADVPTDVPSDTPGETSPYPACAARGGICTEWRWVICPTGTEPAARDAHEDCPGGGWCCVPAPTSSCSSSGYTNCVEAERCTGCWAAPDDTTLTCEAGRVCCYDICD